MSKQLTNPCQVCEKKPALVTHIRKDKNNIVTCYECNDVVLDREEKERMRKEEK